MDFEQALEVANAAVSTKIGRHLGDVETAILRGAWQDQTYEQIAETSGYSVSYLTRDIGPKLWKLLSQALGEPVSKTNFQAALERQWHKEDRERGRILNPKFKLRWKRTKGATQNPKSNRLGRIG